MIEWTHISTPPPEHKFCIVKTPYCSYGAEVAQFNGEKWTATNREEGEVLNVEWYSDMLPQNGWDSDEVNRDRETFLEAKECPQG
jgi:hypothetical protein